MHLEYLPSMCNWIKNMLGDTESSYELKGDMGMPERYPVYSQKNYCDTMISHTSAAKFGRKGLSTPYWPRLHLGLCQTKTQNWRTTQTEYNQFNYI